MADYIAEIIFQSTLPLRGATRDHARIIWAYSFQSTLPLRGATCYDPIIDKE